MNIFIENGDPKPMSCVVMESDVNAITFLVGNAIELSTCVLATTSEYESMCGK
jgi:hypothetical protein